MTKNKDTDRYSCFVYGIGFDACGKFLPSDHGGFSKYKVDNSSSAYVDNREIRYISSW